MLADAVDEVVRGVGLGIELFGVAEDARVPVGRRPVEDDPVSGPQRPIADGHGVGDDAAVGHEGIVDAQDLVEDRIEFAGRDAGAQPVLHVRVLREVVEDDAGAQGDRAEVSPGPVAQDRHDLVIGQRSAVDSVPNELGGHVIGCGIAGFAAGVGQAADDLVEPLGDGGRARPVP